MKRNASLYPGISEAEAEKLKAKPDFEEAPDFIGNAPNYDKFNSWTCEAVLVWLNID